MEKILNQIKEFCTYQLSNQGDSVVISSNVKYINMNSYLITIPIDYYLITQKLQLNNINELVFKLYVYEDKNKNIKEGIFSICFKTNKNEDISISTRVIKNINDMLKIIDKIPDVLIYLNSISHLLTTKFFDIAPIDLIHLENIVNTFKHTSILYNTDLLSKCFSIIEKFDFDELAEEITIEDIKRVVELQEFYEIKYKKQLHDLRRLITVLNNIEFGHKKHPKVIAKNNQNCINIVVDGFWAYFNIDNVNVCKVSYPESAEQEIKIVCLFLLYLVCIYFEKKWGIIEQLIDQLIVELF